MPYAQSWPAACRWWPVAVCLLAIAVSVLAGGCRAEAAGRPRIEGIRPSPAHPGGLVLVHGQGFDGLLSLLVAGRAPARVTPVNDTMVAFLLPEDVTPGPATVDVWFVVGPPQAIDIIIASPGTGAEPAHAPPAASANPTPPAPSATPTPSAVPEAGASVAPGPFMLPTVVPVPRTDSDGQPARGSDNERDDAGDRDRDGGNGNGNGNGRGNGGNPPGRARGR